MLLTRSPCRFVIGNVKGVVQSLPFRDQLVNEKFTDLAEQLGGCTRIRGSSFQVIRASHYAQRIF